MGHAPKMLDASSTMYHLTNLAEGRAHASDRLERELLGYVERGERDQALACFERIMGAGSNVDIGTMAASHLKHVEYTAVALVTVLCRAAMRGGVSPFVAYDHSDLFLQKVARAQGVREWNQIMRDALADACELVSSRKKEKLSPRYVRSCRRYVYEHLNERISVADMAASVGLNATYLSGLFHEYEGITIREFIQKEKIDAACKLLEHTDDSVASIASQLGYCSASHFCQAFRKRMGMTPHVYRNQSQPE